MDTRVGVGVVKKIVGRWGGGRWAEKWEAALGRTFQVGWLIGLDDEMGENGFEGNGW
jgi:hypothetical protein